eukprot:GHVU01142827.1.p1 GENE.GHVU01142827.1~~GHVU01142827.1.p1  ORF type:complete len:210 (-),score=47.97 GHVU01142827.1:3461-4090(-)
MSGKKLQGYFSKKKAKAPAAVNETIEEASARPAEESSREKDPDFEEWKAEEPDENEEAEVVGQVGEVTESSRQVVERKEKRQWGDKPKPAAPAPASVPEVPVEKAPEVYRLRSIRTQPNQNPEGAFPLLASSTTPEPAASTAEKKEKPKKKPAAGRRRSTDQDGEDQNECEKDECVFNFDMIVEGMVPCSHPKINADPNASRKYVGRVR